MIALVAAAWAADPLQLEDVWRSVDATHPLLGAARTRVDAAREEQVAASGAFDPTLSGRYTTQVGQYDTSSFGVKAPLGTLWGADLSAGWQRGVGTFDPYEGSLKTAEPGEWVLGFDVALLRDAWTDKRRATLSSVRQGTTVAEAELAQRRLELLRTAGHRFVDWAAAGQRLRIATALLAVAEERDRRYAAQESLGDVSAFVRLDNQRLVLERQERVITARRAFEQAGIELSTWLRDGQGTPVLATEALLPETFASPGASPPGDLVAVALERRPELVRLLAQSEQLGIERRLQGNQALPALDVGGKSSFPLDPEYEDELEVGLVAEWTALSRTARARREVAALQQTRVSEELRFAKDRITADVRDAESARRAAEQRLEVARALLETAIAVEDGERKRFALGDSNLVFVNQREIATAEASALVVDGIAAAHRAAIDLAWATGTLGDGAGG